MAKDEASAERLLVCIPVGGLNDTFCRIEANWRYAEAHGRALAVDARHSGLMCDFWERFEPLPGAAVPIVASLQEARALAQGRSTRPACLAGDVPPDPARLEITRQGWRDAATQERVTFDFDGPHDDDVLVDMSWGGGTGSMDLARRIRLTEAAAAEVRRRTAHLPRDYVAIHVRNTDMESRYQSFFRRLARRLRGRDVVVCSDDLRVLDHAQAAFAGSTVHRTQGAAPRDDGRPLHIPDRWGEGAPDDAKRDEIFFSTLADLCALAHAREVLAAPTKPPVPSRETWLQRLRRRTLPGRGPPSGFAVLGRLMSEDPAAARRFFRTDGAA